MYEDQWAIERRRLEQSGHLSGPDGLRTRGRKAVFTRLLDVLGAGLRATPLYARGRANALDLRCVAFEVRLPGLPSSFDGYRLLHLSDTHLDVLPELVPVVHGLLDGAEVDLLVMTGDVHGERATPVARSVGLLGEALRGLKVAGPRLAILGNHDSQGVADQLMGMGFDVLVNRSVAIHRGAGRLVFTGLDDVNSFYTEAARQALEVHAPPVGADECRIALVHSAEMADHAARAGYALYLAGHTHGGQICLPGGRPLVTMLSRCRHGAVGLWREGAMIGYTSSGVGVSYPPVRFNCRGGVAFITLRC